jgi:hypothetical protein
MKPLDQSQMASSVDVPPADIPPTDIPQLQPPRYFGYFMSGQICGNANDEVYDHSNLVWVHIVFVDDSPQAFIAELEKAKARGLAVVADVRPAFWAQMLDLHPSYESRWKTTEQFIRPYVEDGTIVALFHVEEPDGYVINGFIEQSLAWSRMETVNSVIKKSFPETPITVTFNGWSLRDEYASWMRIPEGFDWISYDCYWGWDDCYGISVPEYVKRLKKLRTSSQQKLAMIPQGLMYISGMSPETIAAAVDNARRHFQLFESDSDFVAMMPFRWQSCEDWPGVRDIPELRAAYREIGMKFKGEEKQLDTEVMQIILKLTLDE